MGSGFWQRKKRCGMNEKLLHYIWQFRHYNATGLATVSGEPVEVLSTGTYNRDQGPDFLQARIRLGSTFWAGHVELHVRSSDWDRHGHTGDRNYENVVLHVVWIHDGGRGPHPVLELQDRVPRHLLERFSSLMEHTGFIPCESRIAEVPALQWQHWKDRLVSERMESKEEKISVMLRENQYHWEATAWWMTARHFGSLVNMDALEAMAMSIPVTIIAKHRSSLLQLEALLFGQAGLLRARNGDEYYTLLRKEYRHLSGLYKLRPIQLPVHFLRMRPVNFPTVRIAQLAAFLHREDRIFTFIREQETVAGLKKGLRVTASDYWYYHYRFGESSAFMEKKTGEGMMDNLVVNSFAPILYTYGQYHQLPLYKERAFQWLVQTRPEENRVIRQFRALGIVPLHAYETQALLRLKQDYCDQKRCLECALGHSLLRLLPGKG